jgi:outer membrane receptor protein involved in Fe transport
VAPGFIRHDLIFGYRIPPIRGARFRYDAALKVKNLFDNNSMYFVVTQDRYTPDPGREVEFSLTTRF